MAYEYCLHFLDFPKGNVLCEARHTDVLTNFCSKCVNHLIWGGQSTITVEAIAVEVIAVEAITVEMITVEVITVEAIAVEVITVEAIAVEMITVEAIASWGGVN